MQNWTPEMWQTVLIGAIVGFVAGYLLLRLTKDSVKKQVQTEAELQQVKTELDNQKQQLEKHFAESADLLKTLAQDYQKLYRHLAASSTQLLPELAEKSLFPHNLITEETAKNEGESVEAVKSDATQPTAEEAKTDEPPRDYSEGSPGILKAER